MTNNEYINAYKKTQQSTNTVTSSHEIVRTLMKELVNSMQKLVLDIQDDRARKADKYIADTAQDEKNIQKKSKNLSKSLSIIYGLQTSLDFDKALEIANNLFQLYEYCRQEIIKGFSQKIEDGIIKAIDIIKQIMEGWEEIPSFERKDG
ncbi:MAG: flagellar export chaperone FliS [Candidatus Puniceispirillales bacterium]